MPDYWNHYGTSRMIRRLLFLLLLSGVITFPQGKLAFSYVDIQTGELRAAVSNCDGSNRVDLGFSGTFMPVWMGDDLLMNSNYFTWKVASSGEGMRKIASGTRPSVNHAQNLFACYIDGGIGIFDSAGTRAGLLEVEAWQDAAITWYRNDSMVCYFDPSKNASVLFNFYRDSMAVVGKNIVQPAWHPAHQLFVYTTTVPDGVQVYLGTGSAASAADKKISRNALFNLSPVWNPAGDKVAYLALHPDSLQSPTTDLLYCDLVLYDITTATTRLLAENAAYTDNVYPQLSFSPEGDYLYYTLRAEDEVGEICRIHLPTGKRELISRDYYSDERYPQCSTYPNTTHR